VAGHPAALAHRAWRPVAKPANARETELQSEEAAQAYKQIPVLVRREFERQQARMLHEELDRCHGSCVLKHAKPREMTVQAIRHFNNARFALGDFVVMPNHVHAIMQPLEGWELEDILASIKRWTARRIGLWQDENAAPATAHHNRSRFWQQESYDRIIRDEQELAAFRQYIARNPSAAHLSETDVSLFLADWLDRFAPRPDVIL
jgi:type I restriction enzyme R subunit